MIYQLEHILELKNDLSNHSNMAETKLEEKISNLSLGVVDGFVYIFRDGKPQGMGVSMTSEEERPFVNIVPTLLDTDLTNIYNGIGYKENARINSSGGITNLENSYKTTLTGLNR